MLGLAAKRGDKCEKYRVNAGGWGMGRFPRVYLLHCGHVYIPVVLWSLVQEPSGGKLSNAEVLQIWEPENTWGK